VQEFKYAIERPSLEVISGGIDEGESPAEAARRELKEEAGLRTEKLIDLGVLHPFTSIINSPNYLFLALDVEDTGETEPDPGEVLRIVKVPFEEALARMDKAEIVHGASCVLLLKAARWRERP
jgi:8-oxo-dGTP pyrophosphatase MutT (NUDIX family)